MSLPLTLSSSHVYFELAPGARKSQASIEIRNVDDRRQLYKIMTTGRKRYIVKPSSGTLEPLGHVRVEIFLMLADEDRNSVKDKFCIYTIPAGDRVWEKKELDEYISANRHSVQQVYFTTSIALRNENGEDARLENGTAASNQNPLTSARSVELPGTFNSTAQNTRRSNFSDVRSSNISTELRASLGPDLLASDVQDARSATSKQREERDSRAADQPVLGFGDQDGNSTASLRLKQRITQLESELKMLRVG